MPYGAYPALVLTGFGAVSLGGEYVCGLCCAGYWLACFSRVSVVVASSRDIPSDQRFTFYW